MRVVNAGAAWTAFTHRLVSVLRAWAELVDAAGKPTPEKHDAIGAISRRYAPHQWAPTTWTFGAPQAMATVTYGPLPIRSWGPAVTDSANRIAVAIEMFHRDHAGAFPESVRQLAPAYLPQEPLDPFSGKPFLVKRNDAAYTIYSVGPDRHDDGGELTSALTEARSRGWGTRELRGRDIGIRILIRN